MKSGWQGLCDSRCSLRAFVQAGAGALALLSLPARPARAQTLQYGLITPHPAAFYRQMDQGLVQCQLCPRTCVVLPGDRGECGVRENREGKYYSLVYGNPCAVHLDPIEKNPSSTSSPGASRFLLPPPAATSTASSARTGKSPRPARKRPITSTCPRKKSWPQPGITAAAPSPIPT